MILNLNDKLVVSKSEKDNVNHIVKSHELSGLKDQARLVHENLLNKTGLGNEFLGWVDLPYDYDKDEFDRIKKIAKKIQKQSEIFIIAGIGGSYLGARAVIDMLKSEFYNDLATKTPKIYYVGNNISSNYITKLLTLCKEKTFSINVISKSGTTTETALAFRLFRDLLIEKHGEKEAKERIYSTTDPASGALLEMSKKENYERFAIPSNVGGRFSILTAVGLLPFAVAGIDIDSLMLGAQKAYDRFKNFSLDENEAVRYAVLRNILSRKGKDIEILVSYEPEAKYILEWYKQLFGESEGKDGRGIYPSSALFSTDLHSMGQYIQQGRRNLFETVLSVEKSNVELNISNDEENIDGLNYLTQYTVSKINKTAFEATLLAHTDGEVPNIILELEDISEISVGYLIYFFEFSCAISGYLLGINPFDQPGVEEYKFNMFALLDKPGENFKNKRNELQKRLEMLYNNK